MKKSVVAMCAMLMIIAAICAACTAKPISAPASPEVTAFEPVMPTPTVGPTPAITDSSLSFGEYGDMEDGVSSTEKGHTSPIVTDINEAENTPLPLAPTPIPSPTATPKPTSTPTPSPVATTKPTVTPQPTSTPTMSPVPINTPVFTPGPMLTPMPTTTPKPVLTPAPMPIPEAPKARTICNICGADITGNVPAHGDSHLLGGEDFSYRVE